MIDTLSKDSLATILICSNIGLDIEDTAIRPYTTKQWNMLSGRLINSPMKRPAAFFETDEEGWKEYLKLGDDEISRLKTLLGRSAQVAIELENLNSTGIFLTTRSEDNYPLRLKKLLKSGSPPVLFYCGDMALLQSKGVAIIGSRDVDERGLEFTVTLAEKCAREGLTVISGGARGVDTAAQNAAIGSDGQTVSVLADGMLKKIRQREVREAITFRRLLLLSPFHPKSTFKVYNAMGRNKYIYALSSYAVAVSSAYKKGGTWAGATENLKHGWVPLFVRREEGMPQGNVHLLNLGGHPLPTSELMKEDFKVMEYFKRVHVPTQLSLVSQPKPPDTSSLQKMDLFTVVWPYMEKFLVEARTKDELCDLLSVNRSQLTLWLDRAVEEKKVLKLTGPVRYVLAN